MIGRFVWPNGDRGLNERLYRIIAPTLLLWGEYDGLVPPAYAEAFKRMMTGAPW
jgi:pimeloyl-ACP methyl ester carboxylesterase